MAMRREDCLDVDQVEAQEAIGPAGGANVRMLAAEEKTGGSHEVVEFPPKWDGRERGYQTADQDIYVLAGDLMIGDERFVSDCYTFIPAGMAFGPLRSENGARALVFHSGTHDFVASDESSDHCSLGRHIPRTEVWTLPWVEPMTDIVKRSTWVDPNTNEEARPPGVLTKTLRRDDESGEIVALTCLAAGYVDPGTEVHPHNECLYLVAGDAYIGYTYDKKEVDVKHDLVLTKDHYISRPPGIFHGPVCTKSGALWLIYLGDGYTGIYGEVEDWKERVDGYFASASHR